MGASLMNFATPFWIRGQRTNKMNLLVQKG